MSGKSPLSATEEQRAGLTVLAGSRDRGEADRARAVLLTLAGWTSPKIAEAFGVRATVADHPDTQHQILHHKSLVALKPRSRRHCRLDHAILDADA